MTSSILHGDCIQLLQQMEPDGFDAVVTDPPYELGIMGKAWDRTGVSFAPDTWRQVFRVVKPGAHLLAFGGTRTFHRIACAVEDAGWEIRDCILAWVYGTGFPKSVDVAQRVDLALGVKPTVVGAERRRALLPGFTAAGRGAPAAKVRLLTAPTSAAAKRWAGWGTALRPAWEPVILARKPLDGTLGDHVLRHGTGVLNIDGCRFVGPGAARRKPLASDPAPLRRWPPNLILCHHPKCRDGRCAEGCGGAALGDAAGFFPGFRYEAKASRLEKDAGLAGRQNVHPTVKPIALMRWLIRLVAARGARVLDPFAGSGTTGCAAALEGMEFVGCEQDAAYAATARRRIAHWTRQAAARAN
jgi:site-specific DNA-methyltransferase (adenine-specific)